MSGAKVLLDANAVLRYLLEDVVEQTEVVEQAVIDGAEVTIEVLAEVVYVLEGVYDVQRQRIRETLSVLLGEVTYRDQKVVAEALSLFTASHLDFIDCVLAAQHNVGGRRVLTFDKQLLRLMDKLDAYRYCASAAQSATPPRRMRRPWAMAPITASIFSRAALGLPGRFTIRVRPQMPAASRERQARGVIANEAARIASGMPGAMRSQTAAVASGVTSRGEKPVPPVVSTSATSDAARRRSSVSITTCSSGTIVRSTTS